MPIVHLGPHELTPDECRERFLRAVGVIAQESSRGKGIVAREAVNQALFSMMVLLDGGLAGTPGFQVIPMPAVSDREYHQDNDENWWPESERHPHDLGATDALHDLIHDYLPGDDPSHDYLEPE